MYLSCAQPRERGVRWPTFVPLRMFNQPLQNIPFLQYIYQYNSRIMESQHTYQRVTATGLLIALGIIFGDIGTSPLYVFKAIFGQGAVRADLVYGGLSAIFWTLTLQTTVKYVLITIRANNKGEGGVFALYTLVRRQGKWVVIPAMLGGAALLADGMITPAITISSAVEGLLIVMPTIQTLPIVLVIVAVLFSLQRFGTAIVGRLFGPIMLCWFLMMAVLGVYQLAGSWDVLRAISPHYAVRTITAHPESLFILGAVFLLSTENSADTTHTSRIEFLKAQLLADNDYVMVVAHRGAWGPSIPENSILGIQRAIEMGADMVEVDVQRTKDGVLVNLHDESLDRTTTGTGKIGDYTWDEVSTLRLTDPSGAVTDAHIPTLTDVVLFCKGRILVNIDKADRYYPEIAEVLSKTNTGEIAIVKTYGDAEKFSLSSDLLMNTNHMVVVGLGNRTDVEGYAADFTTRFQTNIFELSFPDDNHPILADVSTLTKPGIKLWYTTTSPLWCGGHDDTRAIEGDLDNSWGGYSVKKRSLS